MITDRVLLVALGIVILASCSSTQEIPSKSPAVQAYNAPTPAVQAYNAPNVAQQPLAKPYDPCDKNWQMMANSYVRHAVGYGGDSATAEMQADHMIASFKARYHCSP
jgi:PBP1b-binding outer membrane lipoprotein LpoB